MPTPPPNALSTKIAMAVAALLSAAPNGTFANVFSVTRSYAQTDKLTELDGIKVAVVPATWVPNRQTRANATTNEYAIDVAVQHYVKNWDDPTLVDPLAFLFEQLVDYIGSPAHQALITDGYGNPTVGFIKSEIPYLYVPAQLRELSTYTAVARHTYKGLR